jgi:drug/metabolite transporter (DMT)-like permease
MRIISLTVAAMFAFAANSLLCRTALGQQLIDAASFTTIRMLSGAVVLGSLTASTWWRSRPAPNWRGVAALSTYMFGFSFAYRTLTAGTGALLLFGAVQLTMLIAALRNGERLSPLAWLGSSAAFAGLIYLVAPGLTAPDPKGAALMAIAGFAWGIYSLGGRGAARATALR